MWWEWHLWERANQPFDVEMRWVQGLGKGGEDGSWISSTNCWTVGQQIWSRVASSAQPSDILCPQESCVVFYIVANDTFRIHG